MNAYTYIDAMQRAVDIVLGSPHPDNKVAATLFHEHRTISKTNDWPEPIQHKLGLDIRIGDSSGTVHAEVNCLLHFDAPTQRASLAITDPCCPNCAKCIAEAGIKNVYIDHKGFLKDFSIRRGDEFQDMSMRILAHAGISLYEVARKENRITTLYKPDDGYIPPEDNPIEIRPTRADASRATLLQTARLVKVKHPRWGCALAQDSSGKILTLVASTHPAIGFTHDDQLASDNKYDFYLEPVNRILMGAARAGLTICDDFIWCSVLPSPREMVNLVAANIKGIYILDRETHKKNASLQGLSTLEEAGILSFHDGRL